VRQTYKPIDLNRKHQTKWPPNRSNIHQPQCCHLANTKRSIQDSETQDPDSIATDPWAILQPAAEVGQEV